jgi:cysteine desulfurase/selenocysteine lyase
MGYEQKGSQEIWQAWRHEFPVAEHLIYMNHAAVAPLSRRSAAAMEWLAADARDNGSLHYDKWLEAYEGLRVATARLISAQRDEIAIVKNTSEGIATVALGFPWRSGDRIVAFKEEFPANYYIWQKFADRGVTVDWLSCQDPLEKIEQAAKGARLLALSFVQYLSGYRSNLEAIGEICRRHGVFFFVDAIQGMGAIPLDVEKMKIDALAADGHKWMLGPEGCGVLYVRKDWQDQIEPVEFGWTNVAAYADYSSRDLKLRPDAGRYEPGTLNTIGIFGLRASIELLLEVTPERIAPQIQALTERLAEGAQRKGYELLGKRTPQTGSGIVSFRKPGTDARMTFKALRERGITSAPRQGWLRLSPHFYISPEDVEQVIEALP